MPSCAQVVAAQLQGYKRRARLVGCYYDAGGSPTVELQRVEALAARAAATNAAVPTAAGAPAASDVARSSL